MNRIRRIQVFLTVVIAVLIAVIVLNFDKSQKVSSESIPQNRPQSSTTESSTSGSVHLTAGEHVLYRNGKPYAHVHFKEAIESKERTTFIEPEILIEGIDGKVVAERAEIKGDAITLSGAIKMVAEKEQSSIELSPPAEFRDGILRGPGAFSCQFVGGAFQGQNYQLLLSDRRIVSRSSTEFKSSDGQMHVTSVMGTMVLSKHSVAFLQHVLVRLRGTPPKEILADAGFIDGNRLFSVSGGCVLKTDSEIMKFVSGEISLKSSPWMGKIDSPVTLIRAESRWYMPGAVLKENAVRFPWACLSTRETFVSFGPGSYNLSSGQVNGQAPWGVNADASIRGVSATYSSDKEVIAILSPRIQNENLGRVTAQKGTIERDGSWRLIGGVQGQSDDLDFTSETARIVGRVAYLESATVWQNKTQTMVSGDHFQTRAGSFSGSGHVELKNFSFKNGPLTLTGDNIEADLEKAKLWDTVSGSFERIELFANIAYLYQWGGVFTNAHFDHDSLQTGSAELIVLLPRNQRAWLLGNAQGFDEKHNRIQGDKLTFSSATGKISVYGTTNKVKAKLAL